MPVSVRVFVYSYGFGAVHWDGATVKPGRQLHAFAYYITLWGQQRQEQRQ